jgi:uncharacterized membrane protein YgdD (TMEM256/DUF423 family)
MSRAQVRAAHIGVDQSTARYLFSMVLAMSGVALCLLRIRHVRWAAWTLILGAALHLVQYVITGDVVPLMMYVFILPAGGRFNQETCRPRDQSDRDRLIRENLSRLSQT